MKGTKFTIDELSEHTGLNRRTIRFYVQEGLIEPPAGRGRGGFYYDSHLLALNRIRQLQEQGASLQSIRALLRTPEAQLSAPVPLLKREVWTRIEIVPGLEIHVSKSLEEKDHRKMSELVKVARLLMKEDTSHELDTDTGNEFRTSDSQE